MTAFLIHRLEDLFSGDKICDFGLWLEMFVFDVLGEMTFSKRYGFLEKGEDIEDIIANIEHHFDKVSMVRASGILCELYARSHKLLGRTNALDRHSTLDPPHTFSCNATT